MAELSIRQIGDPILRTPADQIHAVDDTVRRLISSMYEAMDQARGIGLAAPQIGRGVSIFVYSVGEARGAVINPRLSGEGERVPTPRAAPAGAVATAPSAAQPREAEQIEEDRFINEGCLSVSGIYAPVPRYQQVTLTGLDEHGNGLELHAEGLLAACFQHEVDHLHGRLFVDRLRGERKRSAMQTLRARDYPGPQVRPGGADGGADSAAAPAAGASFLGSGFPKG